MDKVTCFALRAIKAWCTAAVESVHLVYTGPAVLTGMTCTVIDICFYRDKVELIRNIVYKICNETKPTEPQRENICTLYKKSRGTILQIF